MSEAPSIKTLFVDIAEDLGIRGILHADGESTRGILASLGLP